MSNGSLHWNLVVAWVWILLGFLFGSVSGLKFQEEKWLGGYASFKRRLYRLGHVSFFGLAIINLLFYFTIHLLPQVSVGATVASWGFIFGAIGMPACCIATASNPNLRVLFIWPIVSLLTAGCLTILEVIKL